MPFHLVSKWQPQGDQPNAIAKLIEGFRTGKQQQTLLGVTGSGKTFVMAKVIEALNLPTLVLSPNKTLAAQLYSEFKSFFPDNAVEYFVSYYDFYQPEAYIPQRDIYIEKDAAINEQIDRLRLAATSALLSRPDVVIVASVSCIYSLGDPEDYRSMMLCLKQNESCRREELLRRLVDMQYTRNDFALSRSNFRVRGDVIEIWPSYEEKIFRVELFGNTIERMVWCHPVSNQVLQEIATIVLYPAKHHVMPQAKVKQAISAIQEELQQHLASLRQQDKLLEASRLQSRTAYDLEMLREVGFCSGIENYSRHFSNRKPGERPFCLFDYFPRPYLAIVDESHIAMPQIRGMYLGDRSRKETLIAYGFRLPSALDNRPQTMAEWENIVDKRLFVSATPGPYELEQVNHEVVEQLVRPTGLLDPQVEIYPTRDQVVHLTRLIKERTSVQERVLVTTLTKQLSEDLTQFFKEEQIKVAYLHCDIDTLERVQILQDLRKGEYDVLVGINLLREGLDLPEVSLVAILDADREGFLRSETSLIQIMGRAARHINAKVVLYADRITPAMKHAIDETLRRRKIQMEYNIVHQIQPQGIHKEILQTVSDLMQEEDKMSAVIQDPASVYNNKIEEQLEQLKEEMMAAAAQLDFEKAAWLRNQIFALQGQESKHSGRAALKKTRKHR